MTNPDTNTIAAKVRAAQGGDLQAYDELFADTVDRLQLFLRVRLGQRLRTAEESVDLLQETYLAAHRAFSQFVLPETGDPDRALFGWLCTIAENCIRNRADHHAAKKRRPRGRLERLTRVLDGVSAGTLGPATRAERLDERNRVSRALMTLADDQRELIVLRHFENRSFADIAERLDRSESSCSRDAAAALQLLGAALKEHA